MDHHFQEEAVSMVVAASAQTAVPLATSTVKLILVHITFEILNHVETIFCS